jgi:hypothetical protein
MRSTRQKFSLLTLLAFVAITSSSSASAEVPIFGNAATALEGRLSSSLSEPTGLCLFGVGLALLTRLRKASPELPR